MRTRRRIRQYKKPLKATPTPRVMLGVGALLAALFVWVAHTDAPAPRGDAARDGAGAVAALAAAAAPAARPQRLVYRHSVVAGGVHSRAELAGAVLRDPVVAAHYANFNVAAARVVRLAAPQWRHVSYRVGDKVFWTSKKVMLAAGELLITDGKSTARTRCGNQVAEVAMAPVMMANEPAPETLDMMYASAEGISEAAAEIPVGQGPAPRAVDPSPVQTAAVLETGAHLAPPLLVFGSAPPPIAGVRIQSAPPTILQGVVVTPPPTAPKPQDAPTPANPPPSNPPPPAKPPAPPEQPQPPTAPPAPPEQPNPPTTPPAPPDQPNPPTTPPKNVVPPRAPTPVPEPGTIALVAGALAVMALARRKKRVQVGRT